MATPSDEAPFAYGDHTVMQLRSSQELQLPEEFSTIVASAPRPSASGDIALPIVAVAEEDAIARVERKLDQAVRMLEKLQQRIDSIDLTLARMMSR